jgi:hypothetical protein
MGVFRGIIEDFGGIHSNFRGITKKEQGFKVKSGL